MQPRKTALAHTALQTHRAGLDMRQRRVLIMADGKRSLGELTQLLGADTHAHLSTLIREGYLTLDPHATSHALPLAPAPRCSGAPATPLTTAAPAASYRRSLVTARLYLLGMLELQRVPAAQHLHRQLHQAVEEGDTVQRMLDALALLSQLTSPGYAQRVQARLGEVLPEVHLPALAQRGLVLAADPLSPAAGNCA